MLGNFFYNKRTHLQYLRLAVAFGRYSYTADKFTLGANGFLKSFKKDKALTRKKVNNSAFVYWMISWAGKESLTISDFINLRSGGLPFSLRGLIAGYFYVCYVKRK